MKLFTILFIGLRNLLRQKRRNIFLGLGVAVGMIFLVLTGSFTRGLRDVVIEKWLTGMNGHIQIAVLGNVNDFYGRGRGYFKDRSIVEDVLSSYSNDITYYYSDASAFVRLIGNKKSDLIQIAGSEMSSELFDFLKVVEGNPYDATNTSKYENPILISIDKAKYLKVRLYDKVSTSFQTLRGQVQTAKFTIVALFKPESSFMDWVSFVPVENMRRLLDYKPYETGSITINLKDVKKAIPIALEMREKLKPKLYSVNADFNGEKIKIASFWRKASSFNLLTNEIKLLSYVKDKDLKKDGVFISEKFAKKMQLSNGKEIEFRYKSRFEGVRKAKIKVSGIYKCDKLPENLILVNEREFYKIFSVLPAKEVMDYNFVKDEKLKELFGTEWVLLPRVKTSEELQKLYDDIKQNPTYADKILITTLYESSSMFLNLLSVINVIGLVFASFLFLIVMVGLANTLRITIRERTREIGTIRAIGMQKKDVKRLFLTEVFLLILISGFAGIFLGIIFTKLIGLVKFESGGIFDMFLVKKRLNLIIDWGWNVFCLVFVIIIGLITAYFPSKRAAKLHPAVALRQYE